MVDLNKELAARVSELEKQQRVTLLETRVSNIEKSQVFQKIDPKIDGTPALAANLTVTGLEVFGNKATGKYHPCFLTTKLEGKQSF